MSVYVIFLSLEPGFLSYDFVQKAKKEENSEDKKSMTEETRCSLAASDKGSYHREWPSEPSNYEECIGASRQNILRTEERGLLNVWTDFNRNSDSESPDDLIPNNILRAQTTRKRTASVITAIRWNTL